MKRKIFLLMLLILFIPFAYVFSTDLNPIQAGTFGELIDSAASVLLYLAIFLCPAGIIVGGFVMLGAGANPSNIEKGKKIILISIVLLLLAIVIRAMAGFFASDLSFSKLGGVSVSTVPSTISLTSPAFSAPVEEDSLIVIPINATFNSSSGIYDFNTKPIFTMSATGNVTINDATSFARIILIDSNDKKHLVFEAMGPFDQGTKTFEVFCQETCYLNGIVPKTVILESHNATVYVKELYILENPGGFNKQAQALGLQTYNQALVGQQEDTIINKINSHNKKSGLRWTAGKTGVSGYTYEQRRALMGIGVSETMPNLAGFEYYKGGIYETASASASSSVQPASVSSNFPSSFDWRNRHGKNWMTSVKNQLIPKDCGSCWAFASIASIEAVTNLYFNQLLNLDLSEQELVSCAHILNAGCEGIGDPRDIIGIYNYIRTKGVVSEQCFSYQADNINCNQRCPSPEYSLKINQHGYISEAEFNEEKIKKTLIEKGPLYAIQVGISSHAMTMVGYDTAVVDEAIYGTQFVGILKNSWGPQWGEGGYMRARVNRGFVIIPSFAYVDVPIYVNKQPELKIKCVDEDGDGYCNWGISKEKPTTCPAFCKPEKDCDDSNPSLGPYDENYNCIPIGPITKDTEPPSVGKVFIEPHQDKYYFNQLYKFKVSVSDNEGMAGCSLFVTNSYATDYMMRDMLLGASYCKNCHALAEDVLITDSHNIFYVKCWDTSHNVGVGENATIEVVSLPSKDEQPPTVSKITPTSATINTSKNFSVNVSDDTGIGSCDFYIGNNHIGAMTLSSQNCLNCTASINHKFTSKGTYSAYAECRDISGKTAKGDPVNVVVSDAVQHVTVRPIQALNNLNENLDISKIELNEKIKFLSRVSSTSGKKISGCFLMIDDTSTGQMNLMKESCFDCEMWKEHTFTKKGIFSAYIKCVDEGGHMGESSRININVIDKQCPALEYPSNMWQRVWYELSGSSRGACIGQGLNEGSIKFDNNWGTETLAFRKSDNLYLSSSRTINLSKSGEYAFTVGSDDGVKVWINDNLVLDKWTNRAYITDAFKLNLTAGNHKFRIDYYEKTHTARLSFTFQEPVDQATKHTLTLSKSGTGGGSVKSIPAGIDCGSACQSSFNQGTNVSLMVVPNSDSNFARWQGACSGTSSNCSVNMNSNKSATAVFEKKTQPVQETWVPCSPSPGWKCDASQGGTAPFCSGQQVGWGIFGGNDGQAICPQGHIATLGLCQGRHSNDSAIQNKEKVMMLPSSETFSSSITFNARSAWYCQFGCGLLCVPDGCAWAQCKEGVISVNRIELTILNWIGGLVYSTSNTNQTVIAWNGKNNSGQQAGNGTYNYHIKTHLSDGRVFENTGKIKLQR